MTTTTLTRADILALHGDALRFPVAELMGWKLVKNMGAGGGSFWVAPNGEYPRLTDMWSKPTDYPGDIAAAWLAFETLADNYGCEISLTRYESQLGGIIYTAKIHGGRLAYDTPSLQLTQTSPDKCVAICKAILLATLQPE